MAEEMDFHLLQTNPTKFARRIVRIFFLCIMVPLAAAYPPLQGKGYLEYPPRFRYWLYEISAICYLIAIMNSDLAIFRAPRYWPRDYGLLLWTFAQFYQQMNHMFLSGVKTFANSFNLIDLASNTCCFTAFILNMCSGQEPIDVEPLIFSVSGSDFSCHDFPVTVPLAATDALAVGVLLKGMLLYRMMLLHPTLGPLQVMVSNMVVDVLQCDICDRTGRSQDDFRRHSLRVDRRCTMPALSFSIAFGRWIILVSVPVISFSFAVHILYKDKYDYETEAKEDNNWCAAMHTTRPRWLTAQRHKSCKEAGLRSCSLLSL